MPLCHCHFKCDTTTIGTNWQGVAEHPKIIAACGSTKCFCRPPSVANKLLITLREGLFTFFTLFTSFRASKVLRILVMWGWGRLVRYFMSLVHNPVCACFVYASVVCVCVCVCVCACVSDTFQSSMRSCCCYVSARTCVCKVA